MFPFGGADEKAIGSASSPINGAGKTEPICRVFRPVKPRLEGFASRPAAATAECCKSDRPRALRLGLFVDPANEIGVNRVSP